MYLNKHYNIGQKNQDVISGKRNKGLPHQQGLVFLNRSWTPGQVWTSLKSDFLLRAANCIRVDAAGTAPKARRSNLAVLRLGLGHESLMRISFGKVPSELGE